MERESQLSSLKDKIKPPKLPQPQSRPPTDSEPGLMESAWGGFVSGLYGNQSWNPKANNYYSYDDFRQDRNRNKKGLPPRRLLNRRRSPVNKRSPSNWLTRATLPRNPKRR